MTSTDTSGPHPVRPADSNRTASLVFTSLIGLATLAILLQGLWAGIFLEHDGRREAASSWIDAHARGADVAIVLTLLALGVALVKLRDRRQLWIGTAALLVLLVVEAFLGGKIRDDGKDTLTAVHVPLGMAIMGLSVWLSIASAQLRRAFR